MSRRVRVVPGRGASMLGLVAGVVMLIVLLDVSDGAPGPLILIPLAGIALSAYNAFGRGLAVYEAELDDAIPREAAFCATCGGRRQPADRYCRSCGAPQGAR